MIKMAEQLNLAEGELEEVAKGALQHLEQLMPSEGVGGSTIIFPHKGERSRPLTGWPAPIEKLIVRKMRPIRKKSLVASIDSSSVMLAEGREGAFYALRISCALVKDEKMEGSLRLGPLLIFIDAEALTRLLPKGFINLEIEALLGDAALIEKLIRIRGERALAHSLAGRLKESIILLDGTLLDPCGLDALQEFVLEASSRKNLIMALAKSSGLRGLKAAIEELAAHPNPPCYADVTHLLPKPALRMVRCYVARFNHDPRAFRVDVANSGQEEAEVALSTLLWHDTFNAGYPDSLRAAHHLSLMGKGELLALRTYLCSRLGLEVLEAEGSRSASLGALKGLGK